MFARIALLFVVVPLLELALLVQMGRWVGLLPTLLLVFGTGVAGAALARSQGLRTLAAFQGELAAGRLPGAALADGLAILVGGAFLLTPGLLTDLAGFALLVPGSRRWIQGRVLARIERAQEAGTLRVMTSFGPGFGPGAGSGFDGEAGFPFGSRPNPGVGDDAARSVGLDPRNEIRTRRD